MQVFINQRDMGSVATAGLRVGEVVEALEAHLSAEDILLRIELDGESVSAAEDDLAKRPVDGVDCLVLHTGSCHELPPGLRTEMVRALGAALADIAVSIDWLLGGDEDRAQSRMARLLDDLGVAVDLDARAAAADAAPRVTQPDELDKVLSRLRDAAGRNEANDVRYVLEEELCPLVSRWKRIAACSA